MKCMDLPGELIKDKWLKTPEIISAFKKIKRADFLPVKILGGETGVGEPENMKNLAELNEALPIGYGQTISQPLVVAFMLEELAPRPGDKILDVGSGSGWTTALLAYIVSSPGNSKSEIRNPKQIPNSKSQIPKGKVIAIELVPELKEFGEKNVSKYNFIKKGHVQFICADGSRGYQKEAPYDKILCSAAVQTQVPEAWKEQLKVGGIIVTPIGSSIWKLIRKSDQEFEETEYPGFAFVPLVTEEK